jgi:type IV secretion system protein VirB5
MTPHKSTIYKPLPLENPFKQGQERAYADLLADAVRTKNFALRVVGIGVLAAFILCLLLFRYAVSLQQTVPVLVNVMPNGEAQYLGEVRQSGAFQVPEIAVQFQAREFITLLRSVSTDYQVLYNNIDKCYAMITSSYEPVMTRFLRGASPFDLVGKARRTVEIESVLKITGSSYQVDWVETVADASGQRRSRARALITTVLLPPDDKKNPLGIYIENCEMTEL